MSSTRDWEQQLAALRGLTSVTGVIHEAQKLQLQYWGALAFGRGGWEVVVDVERRRVCYRVKKFRKDKKSAALVAGLDRSLHWLLGPEWALSVREGRRTVYAGAREVSLEELVNERRKAAAGIGT